MSLSVLFCGSPQFASISLDAISKLEVVSQLSVVSQPDKKRSRGKKICPTDVKKCAQERQLSSYCPTTKDEFCLIVNRLKPDVIIVVVYAMIIPKKITDNYYVLMLMPVCCLYIEGPLPFKAQF